MEIASAFVSLLPSARGFGSKTESELGPEVKTAGKRLGSTFGKMFALGGGILAAAKIKDFLGDAFAEARESQKVGAVTAQVIKSTGAAANITANQVGKLAGAISEKAGVDDEAVQTGANLLLTFKNVRNEAGKGNKIFNQATRSAVDLAATGFGSIESGSKMLGKVLNDPVKGITALSRAGVTFSKGQIDRIKGFVAENDLLSAQKLVLREVKSQVGGVAAASATAGDKAKVAYGNLKEQIGTQLLPVVDTVLNGFLKFAPTISAGIDSIGPVFGRLAKFIEPVTGALTDLVKNNLEPFLAILSGLGGGVIAALAGTIGGVLVGAISTLVSALASPVVLIGALAGAAVYAYRNFEGFRSVIDQVIASVKANFLPVLQTAATTFTGTVLPAVTSLVSYVATSLLPIFSQIADLVVTRVLPIVSSFAQFLYGTLYPAVVGIASAVAHNLKPVFDQLVATFQTQVLPTVGRLLATFQRYQPTIQKIVGVVVRVIGKVLEFAAAVLGKVLPVLIRFNGFLISGLVSAAIKVVAAIAKIIGKVIDFGGQIVGAVKKVAEFQRGVSEKIAKVVTYFVNLPGRVLGALGDLAGKMYSAGTELMEKLAKGVTDRIDKVLDPVKKVAGKIKDLFPGSPVKDGPLRSFNGGHAGRELMLMLARGITNGGPIAARAAGKQSKKVAAAVKKLLGKGATGKLIGAYLKGGMKDLVIDWASVVGVKGKNAEKALDAIRARLTKGLEKLRAAAKKKVDSLQGTLGGMRAFASTIASTFRADLFAGSLTDFFNTGLASNANLKAVIAAFQKLIKGGYNKGFLSALIQSGNSGLILELANADASTVAQAQSVFGLQNSLSNQLGNVAAEFDSGKTFKGVEDRLDRANKALDELPEKIGKQVGKSLNSTASKGKRNQKKGGK